MKIKGLIVNKRHVSRNIHIFKRFVNGDSLQAVMKDTHLKNRRLREICHSTMMLLDKSIVNKELGVYRKTFLSDMLEKEHWLPLIEQAEKKYQAPVFMNKTLRNLDIVTRILNGETCAGVSEDSTVSETRVFAIVCSVREQIIAALTPEELKLLNEDTSLEMMRRQKKFWLFAIDEIRQKVNMEIHNA